MSKAKQTLVETFLERVSRGAVPMGGFYWVDPKELRRRSETVTPAEETVTSAKNATVARNATIASNATAGEHVSKGRDVTAREPTGRNMAAPKAAPHAL